MSTAGHELARWQGGVDERLDNLEESADRIERACQKSNARIEGALAGIASRVGVLEVASGKFGVKVALLVAVLGTIGGIVGTAVATVVVVVATGTTP